MKKGSITIITIWFIVAAFFYASIWTDKDNNLSECLEYTGIAAIGQIVATFLSYPIKMIIDG